MGIVAESKTRMSEQEESEENPKKSTIKGSTVGQKKTFTNPLFSYRQEPKQTAISKKQEAEEEILKANPIAKFSKVEIFREDNKTMYIIIYLSVQDPGDLPYATIELIFNNKNM